LNGQGAAENARPVSGRSGETAFTGAQTNNQT
jgi:hypothetical protein